MADQSRLAAATNELGRAFGAAWGEALLVGVATEVLRAVDEAAGVEAEAGPAPTMSRDEYSTLVWAVSYTREALADSNQRRLIDDLLERVENAMVVG